jgi:hypothetical protein
MPQIFPIILNSTNVVPDDTSTYIYKFPRGSINFGSKHGIASGTKNTSASIAVNTINVYYSWSNVSKSQYNNANFQILFPDSLGGTLYTVELPDGNYEVDDINSYMQKFFIDNGLYHINSTNGSFRYYMELKSNPITYSIDLVCYNVPTSLPAGYTNPPGGFGNGKGYPPQVEQPALVIMSNNFGKLIGYNVGPHFDTTSSKTPQMAEVSSVFVRCSLVNNKFTNPNDIIYAFTHKGQKFGEMLNIENQNLVFSNIEDGMYTELKIIFVDQEYRRLNIKDTNLVIYLVVQIDELQ